MGWKGVTTTGSRNPQCELLSRTGEHWKKVIVLSKKSRWSWFLLKFFFLVLFIGARFEAYQWKCFGDKRNGAENVGIFFSFSSSFQSYSLLLGPSSTFCVSAAVCSLRECVDWVCEGEIFLFRCLAILRMVLTTGVERHLIKNLRVLVRLREISTKILGKRGAQWNAFYSVVPRFPSRNIYKRLRAQRLEFFDSMISDTINYKSWDCFRGRSWQEMFGHNKIG